jgi:signal transduction histidine kinase/ActR/RegA family two-component response regulator
MFAATSRFQTSATSHQLQLAGEDADVEAQILAARRRAVFASVPTGMLAEIAMSLAVYVVLFKRVSAIELSWWLAVRMLIAGARLVQAHLVNKDRLSADARAVNHFTVLSTLDGFLWGMLGWWFTPVFNLEVAVVTISMLVAVSCIGALLLNEHLPSVPLFLLPITVPGAFYSATRHDDLGYFCMVALLGLTAMLLFEATRTHRTTIELLRLRFQSEQADKAKTHALQQARMLAEAKSRFVATMSHEMRTPLHGILGLVRLLQEDTQVPRSRKHLGLVKSSGEHLLSVINDVLDYSKSEAGGLAVHDEPFCLHRLLSELADTFRVSSAEKGLKLDVNLRIEADGLVLGDSVRVRQVLSNLLGNAIKFTPRGTVTLKAWRDPAQGHMVLQVQDTGIGIKQEELPRIFEAFHQAEGTYERRFGGTGLGLTISRDLCQAMGGSLSCESTVGEGTVFTAALPLPVAPGAIREHPGNADGTQVTAQAKPATKKHARTNEAQPTGGRRVLLVEDNPVNAIVAQAILDRLGLEVITMDQGRDAIEWLKHHQADLVLMDCEMPGLDGIETTRLIRAQEQEAGAVRTTIVALTANGKETFIERCAPAGMDDYLSKPFTPEQMAELLARYMNLEEALA